MTHSMSGRSQSSHRFPICRVESSSFHFKAKVLNEKYNLLGPTGFSIMDPALPVQSPDKSDVKSSFRKPSNDAANRKYRRHSSGSGSSSSDGSPNRERGRSPVRSMDDRNRISDDRRKDSRREPERGSGRYLSSRASDSYRHSDRTTHGSSHDHRRHADVEERSYQRSSRSGRESSGTRYDHTRHDSNSDRSRDNWRDVDKYHRGKYENSGRRQKEREINSSRDDIRTGEQERHRDREARDDRRNQNRSPDYKNYRVSSHDSVIGRDSGARRSIEIRSSSSKNMDGQKDGLVLKRKHDDTEIDKQNKPSYREKDGKNEQYADRTISLNGKRNSSEKKFTFGHSEGDEKLSSSSKQAMETAEIATSKPVNSTNQAEAANDLDAAKFAAMKAAELVNRNLVGGSYLSTDQKKKLLWGNKKSNRTDEEPSNRWDLQLFPDRERQEKFNKLMGVKGDAVPERKTDDKDGTLIAEKQREQLNLDLEKQYTAGLRRRDGRTVGLGL